jgi:uncharacterized protein YunC (DUF1805 family)
LTFPVILCSIKAKGYVACRHDSWAFYALNTIASPVFALATSEKDIVLGIVGINIGLNGDGELPLASRVHGVKSFDEYLQACKDVKKSKMPEFLEGMLKSLNSMGKTP